MRFARLTAFTCLTFCIPLSAYAAFPDVGAQHESARAIEYMQLKNIMTGNPDGTFRPDASINRAELMKILVESMFHGVDENMDSCFPDVQKGQWYTPYICTAVASGWVKGYPDGTFKPEQQVNFVEALKMLTEVRFLYVSHGKYGKDYVLTQQPYDKNWYEPYLRHALQYLITRQVFDRDGQAMDGPVPRKRIADMLYRSFLEEGRVEWPIDISQCALDDAISVKLDGFTAYHLADGNESEGQKLSVLTPNGECVLSANINPYDRIDKDFGNRKLTFLMHIEGPTEGGAYSSVVFLKNKKAYAIDYTSDASFSYHPWEIDLEKGVLRELPPLLSTIPSGYSISQDYSTVVYKDWARIYAHDLLSGGYALLDEVSDPYVLHSISKGQTEIANVVLPGNVYITNDEVHYSVYQFEDNPFTGPFAEVEERTKSLKDLQYGTTW